MTVARKGSGPAVPPRDQWPQPSPATPPAHRRARLLACTEAGYWAVRRISLVQHPWAERVGQAVGTDELLAALAVIRRLVEVLEPPTPDGA